MIIGIDASRANIETKTGVEWYSFEIIQRFKTLIPARHRVILYSREKLKGDLAIMPPNWTAKVLPIRGGRLWTMVRLSFEMLKNKPDILFVPSHTLPFFSPKNSYTTVHDVAFAANPELYSVVEKKCQLASIKRNLKVSKKIFTPSEFTKNEIINFFNIEKNKIKVIPLGFNDIFKTSPDPVRTNLVMKELGLENPYLLYVGRREQKKNILNLVKAYKLFLADNRSDLRLVLIGRAGYGWEVTEKYIINNNLFDRVIVSDWLPEQYLVEVFRQASALVYVSYYEGFGLPMLEAMASSTPIIASHSGSLPEIGKNAAYYVNPADIREITLAIKKVTEDTPLRQILIKNGQKVVLKYSWEICAKKTLSEILDQL